MNKDVIKVLVGQRRVGKSCLLFQVMDELAAFGLKKDAIIYINKELHEFDSIRDYRDLLRHVVKAGKGRKKIAVLIDEIQDIYRFEKALRDLQAQGRYDIYCTGSNADLLSGELATYLSGRHIEIEVCSLSYEEFLAFHRLEDSDDSLFKYLKYGGLPYLVNLDLNDDVAYDYLKGINNTILFKDVASRYNIRNLAFLERLVWYAADNVGSLVSAKKISDFLKSQKTNISPNVVLNYLSSLVNAFLLYKVRRSEISGRRIFEINEKYYFQDLGLRNALVGYRASDINKALENMVYMHLKVMGYTITVGRIGTKEVDFVCEKRNERLYVQVAYLMPDKKTKEREFGNLLIIPDNYPKIVVSMDKLVGGSEKGIKHMYISEFLRTPL
jgi:predicted AAA+ superfamily ATPase